MELLSGEQVSALKLTGKQALSAVPDAAVAMNRIYRYQRHFYDLTRQFFLFGRDTLLARMKVRSGARILEVGCGTARNLLRLHARDRSLKLYGVDASSEMLTTARDNLERLGAAGAVRLEQGLAQELCYRRTFGETEPFDAIFFSYSLSMIPECTQSIDAALGSLKSGSSLYIVDFWDQAEPPGAFRAVLERWLALFGVKHRSELYEHLTLLEGSGRGALRRESYLRRYAVLAEFRKA